MISSVRENFPTTLVSSPIGVTSHITLLPAGEGMGEGPLSCELETLVEKFCLICGFCERKNSPA